MLAFDGVKASTGWGCSARRDTAEPKSPTLRELVIMLKGDSTLQQFANKLGVDPSTISLIVNGKRGVGMKIYRRLLAVYPDMREQFMAAARGEYDDNHK